MKYNNFISEVYSIEHKYELISGEEINNEFRVKTKNRIQSIMNDLHIVTINVDSYKLIMSEKGENLRTYSPAFVSSFLYSSLSANILLISNLFDTNSKVLSLNKLINGIEHDKTHLECRHYERREKKDIEWSIVNDGKLQKDINRWRLEVENLRGDILSKIDTLRDKLYAHKELGFSDQNQEYTFSIEEFEQFVEKIFELLNSISSSIFYEGYAFFNRWHPDLEQSLLMIDNYRKYKKDVLKLIRNGVISKKQDE